MFSFKLSKKYLLLLLFIIPISFTKKFHDIWEKYVIDTLLTHFEKKLPNDVIVLAFMVIIICQLYQKIIVNRYIFSLFQQISVVFTLIVYVIYRFNWIEHSFTFTKFSLCTGFVYWDLIIFIPCIVFMFFTGEKFFIVDLYYKLFPTPKRKNGFMLDIPHKPEKETTKNEIITELVKRLLNTESKGNAFAVGIVGEWGTGKTTLLNEIKDVLKKAENKPQESIIIDFNPWNSTASQNIITDFFEHFREELSIYSAEIADSLQSYTQKLASIEGDDWLSKGIKIMTSLFGNNKTMIQEYEHINTVLTQINRQIFVFIDDLDRLDKKEIIEVIRLIRNSANFHNTFFIVAYEKSYVEQAIKEELNPENKSFFLEKIFQLELHLPKREYEIIKEDLYDNLIEHLPFLAENKEIKPFIKNHTALVNVIQNFRDVKRFVNSFSFVCTEKLMEEVYFPDFFHIELIRFKYPLVYDLLRNKTDIFLNLERQTELNVKYSLKNFENDENKIGLKNINQYLLEKKIDDIHINIINTLLKKIFLNNKENYFNKYNSYKISNPKYFSTYFAYTYINNNKILNYNFNLARKDINIFKDAIKEWDNYDLVEQFKLNCENIKEFKSDKEREILIRGIFYFAYLNLKQESFNNKITYILELFDFKDNNILKIFAEDLFENAEYPYLFESFFLAQLNYNKDTSFILNTEDRQKYLIMYFNKIAKKEIDFNNYNNELINLLKLFNRIKIQENDMNTHKETFIKFIVQKDLVSFLRYIIIQDGYYRDRYYIDKILISNIFDSLEDFEETLRPLQNDKEEVKEFWKFYDLCKRTKFEKLIEFKFKHLDIKS